MGFMKGLDRFDCLQFDHDFILDQKTKPVSEVNTHSVIAHRQGELSLDTQPAFS